MKIVGQNHGIAMESKGFHVVKETRGFAIADVETGLVLGRYTSPIRCENIFDEMIRNFTNPNKEYYYMPQE